MPCPCGRHHPLDPSQRSGPRPRHHCVRPSGLVVVSATHEVELGVPRVDQHQTLDVTKSMVAPNEFGASPCVPAERRWSSEGEGQSSKEERLGQRVEALAGQCKGEYARRVELGEILADAPQESGRESRESVLSSTGSNHVPLLALSRRRRRAPSVFVWTERPSELLRLEARALCEVGWLVGCFLCCGRLAQ